jgi:hypothetical protein
MRGKPTARSAMWLCFMWLCLASLWAVTSSGTAHAAPAMSFKLVTLGDSARCEQKCIQVVQAEGQIELDSAENFRDFLLGLPEDPNLRAVVLIQSPGGNVEGSYKLGYAFRKLGVTVIVAQASELSRDGTEGRMVSAQCYSACVFAMMGGKRRFVPPQSRVGVHSIFTNKFEFDPLHQDPPYRKVPASENVNDIARGYAKYMGISPDLINLAQRVPPNSFLILSQAQITKFRLGSSGKL